MENAYLQQLVDDMPIGFAKFKLIWGDNALPVDSEILYVNNTMANLMDSKRDLLTGKSLSTLAVDGSIKSQEWAKTGLKNITRRRCETFKHHDLDADKHYKVSVSSAEQGTLHVQVFDITDEILHERENKSALEMMANFYDFFNTVYDMLFILDQEGNIIHANKTVFDRLGYTEKELYNQSVLKVHHTERQEEAMQNVIEMLQGTREYCPIPIIDKSGQQIAVETRVKKGHWDGKPVLFGVVKDISELKASEEKFSKAFHNSGSLMSISRFSDSVIIDVNDAYCKKLGFTREEVIGKTSLDLNIFENPKEREKVLEELAIIGSVHNREANVRSKKGSIFNGLFNIDLFFLGNELCLMVSMNDITKHVKKEKEVMRSNQQLTDLVNEKVKEITEAQLATITALSNITESRDNDTGSHVERLKVGCAIVAEALSKNERYQALITSDFIRTIQYASVTHDIGKVGVKDSILLKPGKLTAEEFEHIKTHPIIGAKVMRQVYDNYPGNKYIEMGIEIAENHHERWDGSGYPNRLISDQIPVSAQILAICDVYDALRSRRPYKEPFDHETSMNQILSEKGTHFNPDVVDAFLASEAAIKALYIRLLD